ncbi:MAG: hypothetical protein JOZ69_25645 [Myxococcales bacterium]|nr:hypothetical protein [Myxococcales bacterium]
MIIGVLESTLGRLDTIGAHDWDQMEAHRYLVTKTILRFHQFPFWNPYACGGHPNWGGFESGTTVISPWLPFYLTMTLAHAMRVEVWGTALLSAIGAWLFAGRFARSPAARALVVVVFAVNGRWTLQISTGHTWHLAYGLTPWALDFFDRALSASSSRGSPLSRDLVLCAATLALMVYTGGIYPFPHTVVAIALYAVFLAAFHRSPRPLLLLGVLGVITFGLAAPKLLPVIEVMQRWPRIVDSTESVDIAGLIGILTSRDQDVGSRPAEVNARWGWHEFGMYVGLWVLLALLVGAIFGRGGRESPLKWIGLLFFVLGLGAFDPHAPWTLLHEWPVFKSQHVPSRWMYPGLLCLLAVTASLADAWLGRSGRLRPWLEIVALGAVGWVAYDVGNVARQPVRHAFGTPMPANPDSVEPFHTEIHLPPALAYTSDITSLSLSAEVANIGTIDCSTFPGLNMYVRDANGRAAGMGAHGTGDPAYRGEAYVSDGVGSATITRWTPNEVTVSVHGAQAGEHVVLNQNWDPGWSANGAAALNLGDQVGAPLHAADAEVVFRYRPRTFWPGVLVFVLTVAGLVWVRRRHASGDLPSESATPAAEPPAAANPHGVAGERTASDDAKLRLGSARGAALPSHEITDSR